MNTKLLAAAAALTFVSTLALAQEPRPFTEGAVSTVASVRTKPGMFNAYMKWLDTKYKSLMDDEKKAGLIVDYAVYEVMPRSPHDPDLYLVVTYKNFAALDGLDDKVEPLARKIFATRDAADKATAERESIREILGTQVIRNLMLK